MTKPELDEKLKCLLEELRVALPGVQFLSGFLLIAPFNQRFRELGPFELRVFTVSLASCFFASAFLIAPSVYHRLHARDEVIDGEAMIETVNRLAIIGSVFLALALVSSLTFVGTFLFGFRAGVVIAVTSALTCGGLWYALPTTRKQTEHGSLRRR